MGGALMGAVGYEQPVIVDLDDAVYRIDVGGSQLSIRMPLKVRAAELVCIQVDRSRMMALVGDACSGMMLPDKGNAKFGGRDWSGQDPRSLAAMRSLIGRGGEQAAWLPFLSVAENVMLAQMHHTHRVVDELVEQAASLARELGLPGLPTDMPDQVGRNDLSRAAIIRAFMGRPKLVLLEQPGARDPELIPLLVNRILVAQSQGTAVVWIGDKIPLSGSGVFDSSSRYRLRASGVMEALA